MISDDAGFDAFLKAGKLLSQVHEIINLYYSDSKLYFLPV